MTKLETLVHRTGFASVEDLAQEALFDTMCPAICMKVDCDNIEDMEPDQTRGYCSECGRNSMKSALILAELI